MVKKLSIPLCVVICWCVWGVNSATPSAPAPTQDCSTVILSMSDCLSFVTSGSVIKKPEGGCCSGLKTVLKTAPECLCETFKNSGQLGIALNMTKAISLPSACGVKAPSFSNCGISLAGAPGASSPAHSPKSSAASPKSPMLLPPPAGSLPPTMPPSEAPAAVDGGSSGLLAPTALPPGAKSTASSISLSLVGIVGMVVLSCYHI